MYKAPGNFTGVQVRPGNNRRFVHALNGLEAVFTQPRLGAKAVCQPHKHMQEMVCGTEVTLSFLMTNYPRYAEKPMRQHLHV